jgi:hypothetical protein
MLEKTEPVKHPPAWVLINGSRLGLGQLLSPSGSTAATPIANGEAAHERQQAFESSGVELPLPARMSKSEVGQARLLEQQDTQDATHESGLVIQDDPVEVTLRLVQSRKKICLMLRESSTVEQIKQALIHQIGTADITQVKLTRKNGVVLTPMSDTECLGKTRVLYLQGLAPDAIRDVPTEEVTPTPQGEDETGSLERKESGPLH